MANYSGGLWIAIIKITQIADIIGYVICCSVVTLNKKKSPPSKKFKKLKFEEVSLSMLNQSYQRVALNGQ